jgi:hypothetical protein
VEHGVDGLGELSAAGLFDAAGAMAVLWYDCMNVAIIADAIQDIGKLKLKQHHYCSGA